MIQQEQTFLTSRIQIDLNFYAMPGHLDSKYVNICPPDHLTFTKNKKSSLTMLTTCHQLTVTIISTNFFTTQQLIEFKHHIVCNILVDHDNWLNVNFVKIGFKCLEFLQYVNIEFCFIIFHR